MIGRRFRRWPAALLLVLAAPAGAAPYTCPRVNWSRELEADALAYKLVQAPAGNVLYAVGGIGSGESARLQRALGRVMQEPGGLHEVWLNSPGGNAVEGIRMGQVLRRMGAATRILGGHICMSACSYAFLGGVFRAVDDGGAYGLHMFSAAASRAEAMVGALVADAKQRQGLRQTMGRVQAIEQSVAQTAAIRYEFLLEMGVSVRVARFAFSVEANDMGCPPRSVLTEWNVVNTE